MTRQGDWMQTYTGKQFWPLDPRPEEVNIEDIAHALSHQCRYGGHCLRFYSVAEHSVHLARAVPYYAKAWALMHDAAEAYLVDVPRPIKGSLPEYKAIEARLLEVIAKRFGLTGEVPEMVSTYDNRILLDEQKALMSKPPAPWNVPGKPLGISIDAWGPDAAKQQFLRAFDQIFGCLE